MAGTLVGIGLFTGAGLPSTNPARRRLELNFEEGPARCFHSRKADSLFDSWPGGVFREESRNKIFLRHRHIVVPSAFPSAGQLPNGTLTADRTQRPLGFCGAGSSPASLSQELRRRLSLAFEVADAAKRFEELLENTETSSEDRQRFEGEISAKKQELEAPAAVEQ